MAKLIYFKNHDYITKIKIQDWIALNLFIFYLFAKIESRKIQIVSQLWYFSRFVNKNPNSVINF